MPSDGMLKIMNSAHRVLLKVSFGKLGWKMGEMPVVELTTTGRKSGEPRKFPLIFGQDGDDYLLVASKGGAPDDPGWYLNLVANPDAVIQIKADVMQVTARTATDEEKPRLWAIMMEQWPYYDEYQSKTDRPIPVVVLSPR